MGNLLEEHIGHEAGDDVRASIAKILKNKGPKLDKVLLRLRQGLNAKDTKVIKIKGAINNGQLTKGFEVVGTTGLLEFETEEDGQKSLFGTGETLVRYDPIDHAIRLRSVDIALQLHDAYPSKKHQHSGSITLNSDLLNAILDALPKEYANAVCNKLMELISKDGD